MRNILNIALNDLRIFFKDPGAVIGLVLVPIAFAVVFGLALGNSGPDKVRVDVIDSDQSAMSAQFLADVRQANTTLVLCPMDDADDYCKLKDVPVLDEAAALKRLGDNTSLALIEIPSGFEQKLAANEPVSITYRSNETAAAPSYILQAVQVVTQRLSGALVAATVAVNVVNDSGVVHFADDAAQTTFRQHVYDDAASLWAAQPFSVNYQASATAASNQPSTRQVGFGQSIPGMATMFVTFAALLSSATIIREKKNWTFQRLVTMPISRAQILAGKILMYFLLGMIQYLIVFAAGKLMGLNLGNDLIALLLVMVSLTLCMTALGFLIGTFLKSEEQAGAMLNLVGLTLAPLGGAWWPLDIVPDFMKTIGHVSPIAWAMDAFRILLFENGTLGMILPQLAVLLGLAAVFFVFAITRFKYE